MFNFGWTEMLVIVTVAIIVVGPKDLPRMLRSLGRTMGQVRRMSNDFRRQFDEALREAERESGLDETRKELQSISKSNPVASAKKDFDDSMRSVTKAADTSPKESAGTSGAAAKAADSDAKPKPAPAPTPAATSTEVHEAEPLKAGATSERGSDAA
jgi:sec-independent protein translocase protein TatB